MKKKETVLDCFRVKFLFKIGFFLFGLINSNWLNIVWLTIYKIKPWFMEN